MAHDESVEQDECPEIPGLFSLARDVRRGLRRCSEEQGSNSEHAKYLWVHVDEISDTAQEVTLESGEKPGLEDWLNVIDEAASLGVNWFVISLKTSMTAFPGMIEICRWAQDTHGMKVGLHTDSPELLTRELDQLRQLSPDLTRVVVRGELLQQFSSVSEAGFSLLLADPQSHGEHRNCDGPSQMIFVNPQGRIFTCGLVENQADYTMGNIFVRRFKDLLEDPALRHSVKEYSDKVAPECEACPSLLAKHLRDAHEAFLP